MSDAAAWRGAGILFLAAILSFVALTVAFDFWAGLWWTLGGIVGLLAVVWVLSLVLRPFVWLAELIEEHRAGRGR